MNKLHAAGDWCLSVQLGCKSSVRKDKHWVNICGVSCDNFGMHLVKKSSLPVLNDPGQDQFAQRVGELIFKCPANHVVFTGILCRVTPDKRPLL